VAGSATCVAPPAYCALGGSGSELVGERPLKLVAETWKGCLRQRRDEACAQERSGPAIEIVR
jgi:hypothetical protein